MRDTTPVPEATLAETEHGLVPEGEGWFSVNLTDAAAIHTERFGDGCRFEGDTPFPEFGINVRVLQPGQPASMYHREDAQEAFLVLSGECVAIVEDQERPMRAGDLLHMPPRTAHVAVGAGDGPCAILMVGARKAQMGLAFPVSEAAARYGASVDRETDDAPTAYAGTRQLEPTRLKALPW